MKIRSGFICQAVEIRENVGLKDEIFARLRRVITVAVSDKQFQYKYFRRGRLI